MAELKLERYCSIARTLDVVGDPWTFMILREAFFGVSRFDVFQQNLGVARNILAQRLKHLVAHDILEKERYQRHPDRFAYRLSAKGRDLYPMALAMIRFGDRWLAGASAPPLQLFHLTCGHTFVPLPVCGHCGEEVDARSVTYRDGPGAGRREPQTVPRTRRRAWLDEVGGLRSDSVARTLAVAGDRWSILILREAFFGTRRFDVFRDQLGVARSTLATRLQALVDHGILDQAPYSERSDRFEYRLTERGLDLYPVILAAIRWGDNWLAGTEGPPLLLSHQLCGHDFTAMMVCSHCRQEVVADAVAYREGGGGSGFSQPPPKQFL